MTTTNILPRQLDWEAIRTKARSMSMDALEFSILDCREAGLAALAIEHAGNRVDKSQGYYFDEASVYHNERLMRIRNTSDREND
jgi:hypothetical protein